MSQPETVMHKCKKCGTSTRHTPIHSHGYRLFMHCTKCLITVATLGFAFPHAWDDDDMKADCGTCSTRVVVPYQ